jgi:hypothetical protein
MLLVKAKAPEEAILRRLQAPGASSNHADERIALHDAARGLRVVLRSYNTVDTSADGTGSGMLNL